MFSLFLQIGSDPTIKIVHTKLQVVPVERFKEIFVVLLCCS